MPRKTLTAAAALALVAAGAIALTGGVADRAMQADVALFVSSHPGLRVGAVGIDGGRLTLRDVALDSGPLRLRAASISLPVARPRFAFVATAFAQAPAASSTPAAGTATASDVTIVRGPTTYTIKKIDLTGTSMSSADLAALLDPKAPDPLGTRLHKFRADVVTLTDVTSLRQTPGAEVRASLTQAVLSKVADGKVGAVSIAGSTASTGGPKSTSIKTGVIQATGLDVAAAERFGNTVRTDDAEALKTLAETLTVNDVTLFNADNKTTVTIAAVTQKGFRARPLKTDVSKLGEAGTGGPATDDATRNERTKAFLNDLADSVELDGLRVDHVTVVNTDGDNKGRLAIASLGIDDYRARKIGSASVRDFAFENPDVRLGFATVDVAGFVLPAAGVGDAGMPALAGAYPLVGRAEMADIVVDAAPVQEDGSVSKLKFRIAHVRSSAERSADRSPSHGEVGIDHITFDVSDSDAAAARQFLAMGYRQVDLSGSLATTYDREHQTLSVEKILLRGVDMGSATLGLDFGNVNPNILSSNKALAQASALAMLLKRVDLRLVNDGLVDKALALKAKQDGKSVVDERRAVADFLATSLPQALGNGAGIRTIGAAAAAFVADPKTLHVDLASRDGLGASDIGLIGSPDELLGRLDIQAEANR